MKKKKKKNSNKGLENNDSVIYDIQCKTGFHKDGHGTLITALSAAYWDKRWKWRRKRKKEKKRLRPHPSRANTPRTRQNWSAWFPFRFGLRMQRFVRSVYRRLYEDINNLGGVPNIQSSFFLLGFYCVDFNIWISNEQHIYTNQMKGKNQMYTEKETQTQDDILLLPFFYRLNPAVKKRVLKKLGPGMCGNNF